MIDSPTVTDLFPNGQPLPGCFVRIQEAWPHLTRPGRRVAEEIVRDPHWVIRASVQDVATRSETSESAVTRFAQRLGYRGFPAFKIVLSQDLAAPLKNIHEDIEVGDDLDVIKQKITAANIQGLYTTLQVLDAISLQAAVDAILAARRISFLGVGGSAALALDAYHKFLRTGLDVAVLIDSHEQAVRAAISDPSEVLVIISHSGATHDLIQTIHLAKDRGATVVALTAFGRSPMSKLAHIRLHVSTRDSLYRREAFASHLAMITVTDILYVGVAVQLHDRMLANLAAIRIAIASKRA